MGITAKRLVVATVVATGALTSFAPPADASAGRSSAPRLLAKASPDECYTGLKETPTPGDFKPLAGSSLAGLPGTTPVVPQECVDGGGQLKTNQAYVWGLTRTHGALWFGTAPNVHCLVLGGFLGSTTPMENDAWTCEFGGSPFRAYAASIGLALPAIIGDFRPPDIFRFREDIGQLESKSALPQPHLTRLRGTTGLRSAGSIGRAVLLAGPALAGGINVFFFDAKTGDFVTSLALPQFDNVRRWAITNGALYTAVGRTGGGGALVRWVPPDTNDPATWSDPASFKVVGYLPTEGADLTEHRGRLAVTTWPEVSGGGEVAGVYLSRPADELVDGDTTPLQELWRTTQYEPDPVTAATYGGGAIASFGGKLFWGTMHVPFVSTLAHFRVYGDAYPAAGPSTAQVIAAVLGTNRAIAVFRMDHASQPDQRVDLLYGESYLPAYVPGQGWRLRANRSGMRPLFGHSGLGNPWNNYTWTMDVTRRGLYLGTMDWSYLLSKSLSMLAAELGLPQSAVEVLGRLTPRREFGADLFRFRRAWSRAVRVDRRGVGNYANYGIRTMIAEDDALYLGTANPMNLLREDERTLGGWELRRLDD